MSKHSVTIVFGQDAVQMYRKGEKDRQVLHDEGHVETFTFGTEAELKAFLLGIDTAEGWLETCIYTETN